MKNVITIDGPSGSGKGTVSKLLAERLGYRYLDTGALYRAVAWKARQQNVDIEDDEQLRRLMVNTGITISKDGVFVDGTDVSGEIRTGEIGELSSRISAKPVVREALFSLQRNICMEGDVIIEGRDTGTAIFPESGNKFFLDASPEERAERRYRDLKDKDTDITIEKTLIDIQKRDARDASRENSPMKRTEDMVYIDSTKLSIEEVVKRIMNNLK